MILANDSLGGNLRVSKEHGTSHETSSPSKDGSSLGKEEPVKVVCAPVSLKEYSLLHDSLLLGSVETHEVGKGELEPSCLGITMRKTTLVPVILSSASVSELWAVVGESIATELSEPGVHSLRGLTQIKLIDVVIECL